VSAVLDLAQFEEIKPAPRAIFDRLAERSSRVRFMVPECDDWVAVTWGAYAKRIRAVSRYLAGLGVESGERAAIYAQNRVDWMVSAMAIQSIGGVLVPVYPASTASQAGYVVRHADATVLFVEAGELFSRVVETWAELATVKRVVVFGGRPDVAGTLRALTARGKTVPDLEEVERRVITFDAVLASGSATDKEDPSAFDTALAEVRTDRVGLMLYTSGTTGNPKGVPLTYENVGHNGRNWMHCFAPLLEEGYVDLLWLPMSHVFGFGEACIGDALGWTSYLADPATAMKRLPEVRPDVFFSVPAYWEKLAQAALAVPEVEKQRARLREATGGRLKFCLSGGAGLKREVKELFHRNGQLILEGYGLSEASPTLTLNRPNDFRFDSVGKPLPSLELKLAEDGEILAKGPSVFSGYHKDPDATREIFDENGFLKTGDVGRFTEDGFLQIIDRKKEILVTAGGKNVPPANIEQRFADDALFTHVVVYGDGKKYLVAGAWLDPGCVAERTGSANGAEGSDAAAEKLVAAAIERVNGELAKFEQIKRFKIMKTPLTVASGFLTSTLKVRRKKVYEAFGAELEALYEGEAR